MAEGEDGIRLLARLSEPPGPAPAPAPAAAPVLNLGDLGLLLGTPGKWSGLDLVSRDLGESLPCVLAKERGPGSSSGGQGTLTPPHTAHRQPGTLPSWEHLGLAERGARLSL